MLDPQGRLMRFDDFWIPFAQKRADLFDAGYKFGAYYPVEAEDLVNPDGAKIDAYKLSLADYKVVYIGGPKCLKSGGKECAHGETYNPNAPMEGMAVVSDPAAPSINKAIAASLERYKTWFGTTPSPPPSPSPSPPPPGGETGLRFGLVPPPRIVNRVIPGTVQNGGWVPVGQNSAWNALGKRIFRGFCIHIMEGWLDGTDTYFRNQAR